MAKQLFSAGVLNSAAISQAPMKNGYMVTFVMGDQGQILSNDKGSERIFKSIETARKVIKDVGFNSMTLL